MNRFQKTDAASYPVRFRYEALRSLMNSNVHALKMLGDLGADLNHARYFDPRIKVPVQRLIHESFLMVQELNLLAENRYDDLYEVLSSIRNETERIFNTLPESPGDALALSLDTEDALDHRQVGTKASMLARISRHMPGTVPPGFVISAKGYRHFLDANDLNERIRLLIHNLDMRKDQETFNVRTRTIREWVMQARIPDEIIGAIEASAKATAVGDDKWAVRASAVDEDLSHTFASQYESMTGVTTQNLTDAYRRVIASRFSDQAVSYRIHSGFREVRTPMAVLFMPMIDMTLRGYIQTRDINNPQENVMELHIKAMDDPLKSDVFRVMGGRALRWIENYDQKDTAKGTLTQQKLTEERLCDIAGQGQIARERIGDDLHIEWALDQNGTLKILQAQRLELAQPEEMKRTNHDSRILAMGGISIVPGRAEGNALYLKSPAHFTPAHKGSIVIVDEALPDFGPILTDIAALLVIGGHPTDSLATLARECSLPTIFQMGPVARRLVGKRRISVNTMKRTVYEGSRWRSMRERVFARMAESNRVKGRSPLYDRLLRLNMTDPDQPSFKAKNCLSIQDTVLFIHEMSVRSMFGFGDQQTGLFSTSSRLKTDLPFKCQVIDMDHAVSSPKKNPLPEDILSLPFNALWKGVSDKNLIWTQHWKHEMAGLHPDLKEAVFESNKGPRRVTDMNYVIVSKDYMNFNARLFHHYIMVDSHMGPGAENNEIHFRFRGSGGIEKNRSRCASFIETVLGRRGFSLDRKGDIVTAWMRCYARDESEKVLEDLGRLVVCVRELDAILKNDADISRYADHFIKGSYTIFA